MNYDVNISGQADKDIRLIYEQIYFSLMSPENAVSMINRLEKRINNLDSFPKRFPIYKNEIRYMPVDNYLGFYSVDETAKEVLILRVMYGKCEIGNI